MISSLTGPVLAVYDGALVIGVSGLGMRCEVPPSHMQQILDGASSPSAEITLFTTLIVREDSLTLYGFPAEAERDGFDVLMTVSGIGPRLALAALDELGIEELRRAVAQEDLKALQRISGVGNKTAQRMVLEIGDKLGLSAVGQPVSPTASVNEALRDAVEAGLEQLGWPRAVASRAVSSLEGTYDTPEAMLRAALESLGSARG